MWKDNPKLKRVFFLGFLLALHLALVAYVNSSFLSTFLPEQSLGLLYAIASITSVIALLWIPKVLRAIGEYKFLLVAAFLDALALLALSMITNTGGIILVFILYLTLNSIIIFLLDELVQIFSKNGKMGRVRGFFLTTVNLAWVVTQSAFGAILGKYHFSTLYLISFGIMLAFFLACLFSLSKMADPKYDRVSPYLSLRRFFEKKNLARSYKINFLLQFFYSWMVIYTPIYLYAHLGFSWSQIGVIFTVMLLPFVIIQIPLGEYSDAMGERKMLMLGFVVISVSTLSLFFIKSHQVWIWAMALFATRVGAAIIELMSDVYFFKHITSANDEFVGIYRNTGPMAYIFAPILAFLIFYVAPSFNYIFLVLGILLFYGVYLASTIKKNDI